MKIEKHDLDGLNASLQVVIEKDDYLEKLDKELHKYRGKVQLKGFRKGKTPMGMVKKLYGQGILVDTVNSILQKAVTDYFTEADFEIIGQPIESESQSDLVFSIHDLKDYEFNFDIGIEPSIEVTGADEGDVLNRTVVDITEQMIDEELTLARTQAGTRESVDDLIKENDLLRIQADEYEEGEKKEGGWATEFSLLIDSVSDSYKEHLLGQKQGFKFTFDIFDIESDKDEAYVKKYLLNIEEPEEQPIGRMFQGVITDITRVAPAEMDEAFFEKIFGKDDVKNEQEAREKIKEGINRHYERQADLMLFKDIQERLMEMNPTDLPDDFLKKMLKANNKEVTDLQIEEEFDSFKSNLIWQIISNVLNKRFELEVTEEEIRQSVVQKVSSYMGAYGQDQQMIINMAQRLLSDPDQVQREAREIAAEKLFGKLKGVFTLEDKAIPLEDFKTAFEKAKEKYN